MKNKLTLLFMFLTCVVFSQKDSLQIGDKYLEDQIYLGITYSQLFNQPVQVEESGFSYGFNLGYLRDIPIVKSGTVAVAIGIGYSFDSFNHGLKISERNNKIIFEIDSDLTSNKLTMHSLDFPLELRWRTSSANKYKFLRIYTGVKFSYNIINSFVYTTSTDKLTYVNVNNFNKFQYGITLSLGYAMFNFNLYYGLTPLFKNSSLGEAKISTRVLKMGFIFYFL